MTKSSSSARRTASRPASSPRRASRFVACARAGSTARGLGRSSRRSCGSRLSTFEPGDRIGAAAARRRRGFRRLRVDSGGLRGRAAPRAARAARAELRAGAGEPGAVALGARGRRDVRGVRGAARPPDAGTGHRQPGPRGRVRRDRRAGAALWACRRRARAAGLRRKPGRAAHQLALSSRCGRAARDSTSSTSSTSPDAPRSTTVRERSRQRAATTSAGTCSTTSTTWVRRSARRTSS